MALRGLLGVGVCGGAAYTTLQFKDRIDEYAGNLFNRKSLWERAGFNCSDEGICTLSSKAKITIRQSGTGEREITGANLNGGGKIRVYSGDEHSKYNESLKFVIEEGDIDLGGAGITKLEEFETYELLEEERGNNTGAKKYVLNRKRKASDEIKLALGLSSGNDCELPTTSGAEKTCVLDEGKFKKIRFESKGSGNITGFPKSKNLNLKISKVSDEGYPLGLKFVFDTENNITVPGSGGSQIILNKNRGFAVKKSRGPGGVTLSLERAWSAEKILAKVGLSGCLTNGSDCKLGKLNVKQGDTNVATNKTAAPVGGAKIKLYTGDSAKTYSENLKFVVEGGDINLSDGKGSISKLEELETYEITSQSGTYYLTRKSTKDQAIKSSLGLEDGCSLPTNAGSDTSCSIDLAKLKKINFENKASDDSSLSLGGSSSINLKISKATGSDFPLGLKFVFESNTDINVPAQSGIKITLNSNTEYKIKRKEEGKVSLERAWDVKGLLGKVGLSVCTTDNSECTISNLKVKKDTQSETGKNKDNTTPSNAKIVLSTSSAGYKEGLKFSIEGGDITLSGGSGQITKLEEFETYEIEQESANSENYYLTRKDKAGDVILRTLGLTPSGDCQLPEKEGSPKTCSLTTENLKAIKFEDKSSGNDSLAVSGGNLNLKIYKASSKDDFPLGYKFVFESESEISVNTNSGTPLKLSKYIDYKIKKKDKNVITLERAWTVDALIKKVGLTTCTNDGTECAVTAGQLSVSQGGDKKETSKSTSSSSSGKIKLYSDSSYQEGLKFSIEKGDISIESGSKVTKLEEFETYEIKEDGGKYYLTRKTEAKEEIKKALGIDGISGCELPTETNASTSCNSLTDANLKKIKFDGMANNPSVTVTGTPTLKITKTNDTASFPLGYKFVFESNQDVTVSKEDKTNITLNTNTEFKLKKGEKNTLSLEKAWDVGKLIAKVGLSGCNSAGEEGAECQIESGKGLSVSQGTDKKATSKKEQTGQTGKIKLYSDSTYKEGLKFSIEKGDITLQNGANEQVTKLEEFETYEIKDDGGTYYLTRKDEAKDVIKKALGLDGISGCELPTNSATESTCNNLDNEKLKALNFKDKSSTGEPSGGGIPVNLKISRVADKTDFPLGLKFVFESESDITVPGNNSTQIKLNKYTDYKLKKEDKNALSLEKAWDLSSLIAKVGLKDCTENNKDCSIDETGDSGLNVQQGNSNKATKKRKDNTQDTQGKIKVFTSDSTGYREGFRFEVVEGDITLQNGDGGVSKLEEMESYEITEDTGTYYLSRKTEAKDVIKKALGLDGINECELPTENGKTECCILKDADLKKIKFEGITGDNPTVESFPDTGSLTLTITKTEDKSFPLGYKFVFDSEQDVTVKENGGSSTSVKLNKNTEFKIKRGSDNKGLTLEKAWDLSSLIAKVGLKDCTSSGNDCQIDETEGKGLSVKQGDGKTATGKKKKSDSSSSGKIKVFTTNSDGYKEGFRFEVVGGDIELDGNNGISKLEEMESYEITEHQGTYYLSRKTEAKAAIKKALGLPENNCNIPTESKGEEQCCIVSEDDLKKIKFDGISASPTVTGFSSEGDQKLKITKTDDTTDFPLGLKFVFEFNNDVSIDKNGNSEKITLNKETEFKIKRGSEDNNITLEKAWTVETLIKKVGLKDCTSSDAKNGSECQIDEDNDNGLNVKQGDNNKATKKKKQGDQGTQGKIKVFSTNSAGYKEGFRFEVVGGDIALQNGEGAQDVTKLEEFETYEIKDDGGTYYLTRKSEAKEVVKKALGLDQINGCDLPTGSSGETTQCCDLTEDYLKKIKFDGISEEPTVTSFPESGNKNLKITKTDDTKDFPLGLKFVFEFDSGVTVGTTGNGTSLTLSKETEFKIKRGDDNSNITLTKAWDLSTLIGKVGLTTCTDASDSGSECQIDGAGGLKVNQGEGKKSTSKEKQTGQGTSQGKIKVYKDEKYNEGFRFVIEEGDITLQNGTDTNVSKLEQFETYEIKEESSTWYLTRKSEAKDEIKKALGLGEINNCNLPTGSDENSTECCILSQDDLKKIKFDGKATTDPTVGGFSSNLKLKITKTTDTDFPFGYKFVFESEGDVTVSKDGESSENITLNKNTEFKIKKSDNSNNISLTKAWTVDTLIKKVGLSGCTEANGTGSECQIDGSGLNVNQGGSKKATGKKKQEAQGTQGKIKLYKDDETENNKKYSEGFKFVIEEGDIALQNGTGDTSVTKLEQFETYEIKEDGGKYYLTRKTEAKEGIKKALGLDGISNCDLPTTEGEEGKCCIVSEEELKKIKFDGKASEPTIGSFPSSLNLKITKVKDENDFPFGYKFVFDSETDVTVSTTSNGNITLNKNTEFKIKKGSEKNDISLTKAWTVDTLIKKVGLKDCTTANGSGTECQIDGSGLSVNQGNNKKATSKKKQEDSSQGKIKVYGGEKGKGFKEGFKFVIEGGDIALQNGTGDEISKLEQFETYEIKKEEDNYYLTRKDEAKEGIKKALGLPDSGCDLPDAVGGDGTCCIVSETDLKKIKFDGVTGESPTVENFNANLKLKITKTDDTTTYPFGYKFVFESESDIKISKESESDSVILQKNISYKIKKTADSNTISLEKLEVSKLLEKVGLTGCDNITNGTGVECSIKTDSDSGLNVKQGQKKEEKKKQKTGQSSSQGKIKVYGGDEAKGYSERLKFVIEGGDIEIEGGSSVTKLEQFETYEITSEGDKYYLTRKTEAKEGIKKALGLDEIDGCELPASSESDSTCSNIDESKLKKIKLDGMASSPTVTGLESSPTSTTLKISKVTDTTTYPFGYKFVFESDKDVTINTTTEGTNITLSKEISYKIKKSENSNEISLEKLEVSNLIAKVGLTVCTTDNSECTITDDKLNIDQGEGKKETDKKKKSENGGNGKIKVYTGEGAKGYSERLKFVIEEGDIEIEGGTSITKLEEFETYEIKEDSGKYYLTRKDKASSIKKKLLGLPDSCNLPESGEQICCDLEDEDIKKIKFDGADNGNITVGSSSDSEEQTKLKITVTTEEEKTQFPLGYKFVLESNKEITLGGSNKKIAKNTNTEFKIKKSGTGKNISLSLEKAWTVTEFAKKVGLSCPATAGSSDKECGFTDGEINVHNGEEDKIENAKVKDNQASNKKICYEEDVEDYNQGFRFYSENEDITLTCNEDSEGSQPEKKIEKKNGEDGNGTVYYEIKKDNGTWYLYKKSSSTEEHQ